MRHRLLVALLAFAAVAVAGFAWPLLSSTAAERTARLSIDRTAALDRFAVLAQEAAASGDYGELIEEVNAYAGLYQEGVLVLDVHRRPRAAAGGIDADDPLIKPLIDGALRNEPGQPLPQLRPWSTGTVLLTRPVGTGTRIDGVVVLRATVSAGARDVAGAYALIALGALGAAVGCVALALLLSRWVLRPLAELERGVLAIADGSRDAHVDGTGGPPELRAVGMSFNRMSDAVVAAEEAERQLVADASHQLRNPMAALRLRVDALAPSVPPHAEPGYRSLSAEVERMESLLDGLLALASADQRARARHLDRSAPGRCRPVEIVDARVQAWQCAAQAASITLRSETDMPAVAVACSGGELAQVLDVLLDNAIRYTGPGATMSLRGHVLDGAMLLVVDDDGAGLTADEQAQATTRFWRAQRVGDPPGTGLGLAIAHRLITSNGGTPRLGDSDRGGLAVHLRLPLADDSEPAS